MALGTVLIGAVFSLLAATAVARFRFRGRTAFLVMLLVVQMVPGEALLIPLFIMVQRRGLSTSSSASIVVNLALTLPFAIWMLRTFVAAVPRELEEAAWIDGASRFTTFWRVLFPLVAPGLVATSIFSFITAWNEFVFALTLINDQGTLHHAGGAALLRQSTVGGLGRHHGRLHPDDHSGDHLFPSGAAANGLRPVAGAVKG